MHKKSMDNFTVLMSLYYKEKPEYFHECMESIFKQTIQPEQIVIVKDGPLTKELDLELERWINTDQKRFTIISLEVNQGLGAALAEGIKHCRNELIARMDTDDVAVKKRFEMQLLEFKANP